MAGFLRKKHHCKTAKEVNIATPRLLSSSLGADTLIVCHTGIKTHTQDTDIHSDT